MLTIAGMIAVLGFMFTIPGRVFLMGILWLLSTGVPFLLLIILLKK